MIYQKKLNNNVVIALDDDHKEVIVMGKGLGFNIQAGDTISADRIEKIFSLTDVKANKQLQEIIETIPISFVELTEEIFSYAKIHVASDLNDSVILHLCDHIYMALARQKEGITVKNVMLWDIQRFYQEEYQVGLYALDLIFEKMGVRLPEDEAGFIAIHIVNAQLKQTTKSVHEITKLMEEIEQIVRIVLGVNIDSQSVYYHRFITHLRFFAQRLFSEQTHENQEVDEMMLLVKSRYPEAYACVGKIEKFIQEKYDYALSEEEILYLSIHLSRIYQVSK
ncbi:BglG family transcription antiterminator LicT [Enterococcus alcedinis]|uniref:Transcription antiterminator LicT n=1 Tax=Enterococcus alcedinis TaxID=1274384 RepID=A0A917N528_9ENTE|nr:PRD domain-containing protein [Enterococcus alcedinis]MBP2102787.1 beta-glucoside operon transcriptional antiterminator [Enterococcus alcedinis]GGI66348.1 transcription antiterminator LicT [Enterococcus alcedinis]